jgi:hypothetical protein
MLSTGLTGPGARSAHGPFSIALRDGSFIYGDRCLGRRGFDFDPQHPPWRRRAEALRGAEREETQHGSLLYSGPTGDVGWQAMTSQQDGTMDQEICSRRIYSAADDGT